MAAFEAAIESAEASAEVVRAERDADAEEADMRVTSLEGALAAARAEAAGAAETLEAVEEKMRESVEAWQSAVEEAETLKADKADLNETCVILEER